jgi:hypothetical protein
MIESKQEFNELLERLRTLKKENRLGKHMESQLQAFEEVEGLINLSIYGVSCCFADKEILSNSLRFALTETPTDEQGALKDFKKYQSLMRKCMLWLKDNYEPPCDGFMNECEA